MFSHKHSLRFYLVLLFASIAINAIIATDTFAHTVKVTTPGLIDITVNNGQAKVAESSINVESTCPYGYTLSIQGPSDTNLYKDGNKTDTNKINTSTGTMSSPVSITGSNLGTWGYSMTSSTATSTFIGLTSTSTTLTTKSSASNDGGDNIPIYYAASATNAQAAGTYALAESSAGANDNVVTYLLTTPPSCNNYAIRYNDNGANSTTLMSNQTIDTTTDLTLWASNFKRVGFGFAGWNTKADGTGTSYGPNQTIPKADLDTFISTNVKMDNGEQIVELYAMWVQSEGDLRGWTGCNSLAPNAITALTDTRDNNTYAIAKLADGKCWMIENLRLDNAATINSANTNNPSTGFALTASSTGWCTSGNATCQNEAKLNTDNTSSTITEMTDSSQNVYSYGNYYNYYAATTGYGTRELSAANTEVAGDICPAGWHLPIGGNVDSAKTRDFYNLIKTITGEEPNTPNDTRPYYTGEQYVRVFTSYPNNFLLSGSVSSNIKDRGLASSYWSETNGTAGNAYRLSLSATQAQVNSWNSKYNGFLVRCIISGTYSVEFDPNGGEGTMASQSINRDVVANLTANTFTRQNHVFAGWNTAADGSGANYSDGASVTNLAAANGTVTLYAKWYPTYTIAYDANGGGTGTTEPTTVTYNTSHKLRANGFTSSDDLFSFLGWSTSNTATTATYTDSQTLTIAQVNSLVESKASGATITLYAVWGIPPYKIGYSGNGHTSSGKMGYQGTSGLTSLWAPNYARQGYGFAGWSEVQLDPDASDFQAKLADAVSSGKVYGPEQYVDMYSGGILYAVWVKSTGDLQNWTGCSSMEIGQVTALTDLRDNDVYAVAKLADNKCWMIENLRLGGTAAMTLDSSTTNITDGAIFTLSASQDSTWCNDDNSVDCVDQSMLDSDNKTNAPANVTSYSDRKYSYGNYYNWYSATAGTGTYSSVSINATGSICPKGWRLPAGGEFYALNNAVSPNPSSPTSVYLEKYPNNFIGSAGIGGSFRWGSDGIYWSSTANYHVDDGVYVLWYGTIGFKPGTYGYFRKSSGAPVRCLMNG